VPAPRPATDAETLSVTGAVPPAGVIASQEVPVPALNVSVPVPPFATLRLAADELAPPAVAVKASDAGVTASSGVVPAAEVAIIDKGPSA
jgi:hypothetical protein